MLIQVHPKLPMRNKRITRDYYVNQLGFKETGSADYAGYLMVQKDQIALHFFEHSTLNPLENDGQVYIRTTDIDNWYQTLLSRGVTIHPAGHLQDKPWGQREFALLDPDHNLLTFGQEIKT